MTPVQAQLLDWERDVAARRLSRTGALNRAHEQFGLSETRYHQTLLATVDDADALVAFPDVVRRLQRLQTASRQARQR